MDGIGADHIHSGIRRDNPNDIEQLAGGKYAIHRNDKVLCMITKCQRDPKVYGEDANEFKPERMLDENFNKLPKSAWRPFGTGVRACIGQAFAWQEAQVSISTPCLSTGSRTLTISLHMAAGRGTSATKLQLPA